MAVRKTVRIYDLAKELKQDTKRVMEELRRAGADVSVASNSVPIEFADKLRNKYIAKAEAPAKPRAIKVIKAARKEETPVEEEPAAPVEAEVKASEPEPIEVTAPEPAEAPEPEPKVKKTTKVLKPKVVPAADSTPPPVLEETTVEEPVAETPAAVEVPTPEPAVKKPQHNITRLYCGKTVYPGTKSNTPSG